VGGPEVVEWEVEIKHGRRLTELPELRHWDRWADPNDGDRWVAVLYVEDIVYTTRRNRPLW
jgi:hypothetical protein